MDLSVQSLFETPPLGVHRGPLSLAAELVGWRNRSRRSADTPQRVLAAYRSLLADVAPPPARPVADEPRWFAESVLLWCRLQGTAEPIRLDTLGSPSLSCFPNDLPSQPEARRRLRDALSQVSELTAEALGAIDRELDHVTSNLELKRAVSAALFALFTERGWLDPAGRVQLMCALYGELPWRAGDIDLVHTATAVHPCVPRAGTRLAVPDWSERPEPERRALSGFLKRVRDENVAHTERFPSFGHFDTGRLCGDLFDALCARVEAPREVIRQTLATMVMLVQTQHAEAYLVHDIWGHTWQETLCEFEWEYERSMYLTAPLSPADGPRFGGPETPPLLAAFSEHDGRVQCDVGRFVRTARADLRGRVQVANSLILAELLADFMECKFARLRPDIGLPTTSLLPARYLKLDLNLQDTIAQVGHAVGPYRAALADRAGLLAGLRAGGLTGRGLAEAVDAALVGLEASVGPAITPGLDVEHATVLNRIALQVLRISAQLERALERTNDVHWTRPGSCPDLIALATAHAYERDRARAFWSLDTVIGDTLPRWTGHLADVLAPPG